MRQSKNKAVILQSKWTYVYFGVWLNKTTLLTVGFDYCNFRILATWSMQMAMPLKKRTKGTKVPQNLTVKVTVQMIVTVSAPHRYVLKTSYCEFATITFLYRLVPLLSVDSLETSFERTSV